MPEIEQAAQLLAKAEFAVALTGAGISTPSGIPDFRTRQSGLWAKYDPMIVASIYSFKHRPEEFYDWIRPLIRTMLEAQPNAAHIALARLEQLGRLQSIITQNIDLLHSRAGSTRVHEVHGHVREATCIDCYRVYPAQALMESFLADDSATVIRCPACNGVLKPNVILFGEQLPFAALEASERDARHCDLMLIAGSSLEVYPVADLPRKAHARGSKLILVNYDPTPYDDVAEVVIRGDVAEVLPKIVEALEASLS
jgi:NAD-dependent deacetylase